MSLEIFQDPTLLFGLRRLKIFTRVIIGGAGSLLDISAPTWDAQVHESSVTAKHGFDGPTGKNCLLYY